MFEAERIYNQRNPTTGITEWFFLAREGDFGPYDSRQAAEKQLHAFIDFCVKNSDDGGRNHKANKNVSQTALDILCEAISFDLEPILNLESAPEFSLKRREYR